MKFASTLRYRILKIGLSLIIVFGALWQSFAQKKDSVKVYDFVVANKVNGNVQLIRKDTVLYTNYPNHILVKVKSGVKLGTIIAKGGSLDRFGNSLIIRVKSGATVLLTIFQIQPDGSETVAFAENIPIVDLAKPWITVAGVPHDSIVNRANLLADGRLIAHQDKFGRHYRFYIKGFYMQVNQNGKLIHMSSGNNKLTARMREVIKSLPPGVPLYFMGMTCVMKDGKTVTLDRARIFLDQRPELISVNSE